MKTKSLQPGENAGQGDCVSFHSFPLSSPSPVFRHSGFQLLLLPVATCRFKLVGESFDLPGPQLLLLGPQLRHGWVCPDAPATPEPNALAIRWPGDLFGNNFLDKNQMKAIGALMEMAARGIRFPAETIPAVRPQMVSLRSSSGFTTLIGLLRLLHELSAADGQPLLDTPPPAGEPAEKKSSFDEAMDYMEANYFLPMTLEEMAGKACMTKGSFCRSFRRKTGKTYSESLNEIRIGHICRLLVETTDTVAEIAYRVGYQNIFHFHRHFKRQTGSTPKQYRREHQPGESCGVF
ncbi:AraC family transcriptional regulator [Puia sp.]|uniref:helix-turn-helix domain-containing protein n=1 Tax=Puia sp. TaxID=2045100 RepID=UPI002F42FEB9